MAELEQLQPAASVRGITPDGLATVVNVAWYGSDAVELTYKDTSGRVASELLYRHDEPRLEVVEVGRPWSFDGDGALFRLVSEAQRIRLAHLFDPVLAVHTSLVEPLPHQITAVYEAMLPRQPLRFLLADDPGAGKTIMAGLLIKELIARGDLKRCLIVCPGSLVEQWQDELSRKFQLPFEIATNDKMEAARTGNWFVENDLAIARLDNATLDEVLEEQEGDFDADSRWALTWFDQHGYAEGEYGVAEQLSKAKNTSVDGLVQAGIIESRRGDVRILKPVELNPEWDPSTDSRLTVWEMTQHLIRLLESGGEQGAGELAAKLGSQAEAARDLAYRLYLVSERKRRAADALAYNGLVQSWPEIVRIAGEQRTTPETQGTLDIADR